jgi:predicted DNA-binding transcriptional regulator AlpA
MDTTKTPSTQERPLATAKPWTICGISRAQWFKLYSAGRTPLAIRLGTRRPVYLIAELESWLQAGAPDRITWQRLREGKR